MMEITGHTRFGGLLGSPVSHSISPMMHNLSFQTLGIDAVYLCFETRPEKLKETLEVFRNLDTFGFNLTMPLKETVVPLCDSLSEGAAMMGAVNTLVNETGIPVCELDPMTGGPDDPPLDYYETVMIRNVKSLLSALSE